jgi:hypothetical protein
MKRQKLLITLAAAIAVLVSVSMAGAYDTSPYLAGIWEEASVVPWNVYVVVNPTTKPLDVCATWHSADGGRIGCICSALPLPANGMYSYFFGFGSDGEGGAVKFFAFPAGTRKFDPNAVIGGFQRKSEELSSVFKTEANLKAVTINSSTIGEFTQVEWDACNF